MSEPTDNTPFDTILDELENHACDGEVAVRTIQEEIGEKSFGALLFLPALLEISPIGGVPGVPTFLAAIVLIIAVQIMLGREHIWLPDAIERRTIGGDKLKGAAQFLRKPARWVDRTFHDRMTRFTTPPFDRAVALLCAVLALTVPPLELFPFASTIPMAAIALLGLALLFDDGLLVLVGLVLAVGTLGTAIYLLAT